MRRQRLPLALLGFVVGGLVLATPQPSYALTSETFSISVEVGAGRTLPSGSWGYNDVCEVGYNLTAESRCAVEFSLTGILSSAKILSAQLTFNKTGGCGTQDCPVDLALYTGDGGANLPGDVVDGSVYKTFTPGFAAIQTDLVTQLQSRVGNGDDYLGVRLSRSSTSARNPDVQTFGYTSFKLAVTFIQRPVDITVHLAGLGDGTVTSNPFGINCGQACTGTFEWLEPVTLFATPQNGGFFSHWEGGECDGSTEPECSFDTPATDPNITAYFDPPIGPPISQPPPTATPPQLTPPPLTPAPTSKATGGTAPTAAPAPTDIVASDGTIITPAPTLAAVASGAAPTIVGLGDGEPGDAAASGGIGLPVIILLILVLGGVVGGGVYWYTKRRATAAP